jgi:hypothetical protein
MTYLFFAFWLCSHLVISSSSTLQQVVGQEYNQMNYLPSSSPTDQFTVGSKLLCVAQCARQLLTCNVVVFDRAVAPPGILFNEPLVSANLFASVDTVVIDFGRINTSGGMYIETFVQILLISTFLQ